MVVATGAAPAIRRERAPDAAERAAQRPIQADERPRPLGPARGIALAVGVGALAWALLIAFLLRF